MEILVNVKVSKRVSEDLEAVQKTIIRKGLNNITRTDVEGTKALFSHPPSKGDIVAVALAELKKAYGL